MGAALRNPVQPANTTPLASGAPAIGTSSRYAREDHVHPAAATPPGQQAIRAQTNSSGIYTWTFSTPFANGVVPIIEALAEYSSGSTDVVNVQLSGTPTNTQAVIRVTRTNITLVGLLGLSILSIPASVGAIWVHLTARAP